MPTTDVDASKVDVPLVDDRDTAEETTYPIGMVAANTCPCADCLNGREPRRVAHDMTDDYVMELRRYRHDAVDAEVDVPSGDDLAQSEESSKFDIVEYQ